MTDDDDKDAGYARCIDQLNDAAAAWMRAHPFAELRFDTEGFVKYQLARAGKANLDWTKAAIIASLRDCIDRWAANEDARAFLHALDEATGGEATFMQVRALIDYQLKRRVERASGQLGTGDWRCASCKSVLDGFANLGGEEGKPPPGSITVCAYCGTIQRINATADAFDPVDTRDINALPKSARVQLMKLRAAVLTRIADEKARS